MYGEGLQDTECPASKVGLVSAESSTETECSVDIVDLVYAEGSEETECLVDIVSGLVEVSSLVVDMPNLVEFLLLVSRYSSIFGRLPHFNIPIRQPILVDILGVPTLVGKCPLLLVEFLEYQCLLSFLEYQCWLISFHTNNSEKKKPVYQCWLGFLFYQYW